MSGSYRFGRFELRPTERQLLADGRRAEVGARAFDVLHSLIERRDQVVSKNELLDLAWPGLVVEENNLQVQISALRKVLGQQSIATIAGRGYRFALSLDEDSAGAPATSPKAVSPTAAPRTAADPADTLYGRAEDLATVCQWVKAHGLVTVVGPAGVGKTRLAQATARQLAAEFADGVRVVEFAPLADPAMVTRTVARAVDVDVGEGADALDRIVRLLADRRLLLVLDNCEHLLDAVELMVAALRRGAPGVHLLATSQEVLRMPDEHVYRLGALALPADATLANARNAGAVELFVARARAAERQFQLGDDNVAAVVEICRRLDGNSLAIELAAARIPLLGAEGVRRRLADRFRLLTAGSRMALRRHQTLRAALEWSYGLLSADEQSVFDRLGVFAGSFALDAAQRLAADEHIDEWAVLEHLGALVDKSLVSVEGLEAPRYRLLETSRAYALERLAARGITAQAMRRHAEVTLDLFERYHRSLLSGADIEKTIAGVAADFDNLENALRWAVDEQGDRRIAIALSGAAMTSDVSRISTVSQVSNWCDRLRPLVDDTLPVGERARFWLGCAFTYSFRDAATVAEDARKALALYRELDDRLGTFHSLLSLAGAMLGTGQLEEARRATDEAFRLFDPSWPPERRSTLENIATFVYSALGDHEKARRHALENLASIQRSDRFSEELTAIATLIDLDMLVGNFEQAARSAGETIARYRSGGFNRTEQGLNLRILATALTFAGRLDEADVIYRDALYRVRMHFGSGAPVLYDASLLLAKFGRIDDAARVFAYAEGAYAAHGRRPRTAGLLVRERLLEQLAGERPAEVLRQLFEQGRQLADEKACSLAFPPVTA